MWRNGVDMNMKTSWNKMGGTPNIVRKTQVFDAHVQEVGESLASNRKVNPVSFAVWMVNTKIYEKAEEVIIYCRSEFFLSEIKSRLGDALYGHFIKPIKYEIDKSLEPKAA
jgi:hypothetical protein